MRSIARFLFSVSLKENKKSIQPSDFVSLLSMLTPAALFALGLSFLATRYENFRWLLSPSQYPLELWIIAISGSVATAGGFGDWLFHRAFVAAGPNERKAHLLALASGGVPLFILMAIASISTKPAHLLVPILIVLLYTTALICYDEFLFHRKRCTAIETLMHRLLVFGNGVAFLAWIHWCFVRGMIHG